MSSSTATNLVIVGAGPAGCAAALMCASLGVRTTLVESESIGGKLHVIGALSNVPGAWTTGPALAQALAHDISRIQESGDCELVASRAVGVSATDTHVEVILSDGRVITGSAVVVATGVGSAGLEDAGWISSPGVSTPAPLWRARPDGLRGRACILGGDRPLGTWLRAHQDAKQALMVVYPAADSYKIEEVRSDPRVRLHQVSHLSVSQPPSGGYLLHLTSADRSEAAYACDTLLSNLGTRPASLDGLTLGADGYCPPELQHPRIITAGDLRSAQFQRIVTAQGSGAQAALSRYYAGLLQTAA